MEKNLSEIKPIKKLVICISGGLDSFGAYCWAKNMFCPKNGMDFDKEVALLQVVDTGCPYWEKEVNVMDTLYGKYNINPQIFRVVISGYRALGIAEDDHVILGRNAMLASIAVRLGLTVWICGTSFENNSGMVDKNHNFFKSISDTLSYACGYKRPLIDVHGMPYTKVYSPFQGTMFFETPLAVSEKHGIIRWLEVSGVKSWRKTTSCFHPKYLRCGVCSTCGKRFVYEKYVELEDGIIFKPGTKLEDTYRESPLNNVYLQKTIIAMKNALINKDFSRYLEERIQVYKRVLDNYNLWA